MKKITITIKDNSENGKFELDVSLFPQNLPLLELLGALQLAIQQTMNNLTHYVEDE